MRVYKKRVVRSPWAPQVVVSRMQNGRWIIDIDQSRTTVPANTFANWDEAEWTGNQWANDEMARQRQEQEAGVS